MTHIIYNHQQLQLKSIARLKEIYSQTQSTVEVSDKRCKDSWISAILDYQGSNAQKVTPTAAEPLTTVEISFYDHEFYAGFELVAAITHDDNLTQPWVVMVNGVEKFRANTWMRCYRYISWHHQDGTLKEAIGQGGRGAEGKEPVQELFCAPLPLRSPTQELPCTTGNEIMAQIFNECEKYGFALLDDGIYTSNCKLGEVGCTEGSWWAIRAGEFQQMPCDSALDAVCWLSMVNTLPHAEVADYEEMLDRPFEMLTTLDWELLREYEPVAESRQLVTA